MATAKMHNGVAIVAYVNGKAVDSEGREIEGAPKPPKDTDPSEQPGVMGALSQEERLAVAVAKAVNDPKGTLAKKRGAKDETDARPILTDEDKPASQRAGEVVTSIEDEGLPSIADLSARLATLTNADAVRAMQKRDPRKKARPLYKARLAELKGT